MAHGGKRAGAGRRPGSKTALTRDAAEKLAADGGVLPLDVMIETMRELWRMAEEGSDLKKRVEACAIAEKAAPYLHPRLAAVEHSGEVNTAYVARMPAKPENMDEWQKRYAPQPTMIQ